MAFSKRPLQLGERIRSFVALMLSEGRIADPRLRSLVIYSVKVSPDLEQAKVYYALSQQSQVPLDDVKKALKLASGFMRTELGLYLKLRHIPKLVFYYDDRIDYAMKVNNLLLNLQKDRDQNPSEE